MRACCRRDRARCGSRQGDSATRQGAPRVPERPSHQRSAALPVRRPVWQVRRRAVVGRSGRTLPEPRDSESETRRQRCNATVRPFPARAAACSVETPTQPGDSCDGHPDRASQACRQWRFARHHE